jgi:hypothetical protein
VLVETVGILTIAPVGGPTARLNVGDAVWVRSENAKKRLRVHRAGPDFNIVGLLEDASLPHPKMGKRKDEILKI